MSTRHLLIREITIDDIDAVNEIQNAEDNARYVKKIDGNKQEREDFVSAYIKNMYGFYGYGVWVVTLRDGTIIGCAGISNREYNGKVCMEIGYMLGSSYRNKGYALEAVKGIMDYAYNELEVNELYCFIDATNYKSIKFAEKLLFCRIDTIHIDNKEVFVYRHR